MLTAYCHQPPSYSVTNVVSTGSDADVGRTPGGPQGPAPDRAGPSPAQGPGAHTGDMRRIIGTIVGAILAVSLAITTVGRIVATLKTFLIIGLIAMAVIIIVWLVARRPRRD